MPHAYAVLGRQLLSGHSNSGIFSCLNRNLQVACTAFTSIISGPRMAAIGTRPLRPSVI